MKNVQTGTWPSAMARAASQEWAMWWEASPAQLSSPRAR